MSPQLTVILAWSELLPGAVPLVGGPHGGVLLTTPQSAVVGRAVTVEVVDSPGSRSANVARQRLARPPGG